MDINENIAISKNIKINQKRFTKDKTFNEKHMVETKAKSKEKTGEKEIAGVVSTIAALAGKHLLLLVAGAVTVFPFVWMILSALKTKEEVMNAAAIFPSVAQWGNLSSVLLESPIPKYIGNSLFVAIVTVAIQIVTGAMLTYALVFFEFKGKKVLFAIIMGTYMLPAAATYIPSYIILSKWHMLNTYRGLIISQCVSVFGIFLLRQAFEQFPRPILEAARMDGASHWKTLWHVVFPMTKASFITFGLMSFISLYNNYMWPSLITDDVNLSLVSQGLRRFFIEGGAYGTNWSMVMAGSTVIIIPLLILFMFTQKWFISGIGGDNGVKG